MENNKIWKIVSILFVVVIVFVGLKFLGWSYEENMMEENPNEEEQMEEPVAEITYLNSSSDLIQVESPQPGSVVGKEFNITGKARGYWFFEASFPVELQTLEGNTLGGGVATADGEWMTEDFVNFNAEIQTPSAFTGPAILILKKDNPSGLPENEASISFPIIVE